jgi:hypothetical protein
MNVLFTSLLRNLLCRKHCDCFIEQELLLLVIVTDIIICIPRKLNHKSVYASQKAHYVSESQMFWCCFRKIIAVYADSCTAHKCTLWAKCKDFEFQSVVYM